MQCPARHQINRATEQLGELIRQLFNVPAKPATRAQRIEHIDIAIVAHVVASRRTEDEQLSHAVLLTYGRKTLFVYNDARNRKQALSLPMKPAGTPNIAEP
jgi:hypothetical protein